MITAEISRFMDEDVHRSAYVVFFYIYRYLFRHTWQPVEVTTSTTKNNTHKDRLQIENDIQKIKVNVRMKTMKIN